MNRSRQDLMTQFGGLTFLPQPALGIWLHEGVRYEDELVRLVIDVDDSQETQRFFTAFKEVLKERFEQLEIYLVSYPIERV